MEKVFADLQRAIKERGLTSQEDVEAYLQALVGSDTLNGPKTPRTPLDRAQDLIYDAWEEEGERKIQLAQRALKISPDCADAYVVLAEEADTLEKARDLYEQGVTAGERAIGAEAFTEMRGRFWGVLETRPYMRARFGFAHMLWMLGERRQAVTQLQEMLRLNPSDNQGLRYVLMTWLAETGEDNALGELLQQYGGDISATWYYTYALWLYRAEGPSQRATEALRAAIKTNTSVPDYLLGRKALPADLPDVVGIGDDSEATSYTADAMLGWRASDGALTWLAGCLASSGRTRPRKRP
jgi:tetratricopeptide (TPR) repeat protein